MKRNLKKSNVQDISSELRKSLLKWESCNYELVEDYMENDIFCGM